MTTPQESHRIAIDPDSLPKRLLMCHEDKTELADTGALAYIKRGESQRYHQRTSLKPRRRWHDLGERDNVYLGMDEFVDTTVRTFLIRQGALFRDNFQVMPIAGNVAPTQL